MCPTPAPGGVEETPTTPSPHPGLNTITPADHGFRGLHPLHPWLQTRAPYGAETPAPAGATACALPVVLDHAVEQVALGVGIQPEGLLEFGPHRLQAVEVHIA